jgi:hypothetical protein
VTAPAVASSKTWQVSVVGWPGGGGGMVVGGVMAVGMGVVVVDGVMAVGMGVVVVDGHGVVDGDGVGGGGWGC